MRVEDTGSGIDASLRDKVFDNTGVLQKLIEKDYLRDSETMSLHLTELHVA